MIISSPSNFPSLVCAHLHKPGLYFPESVHVSVSMNDRYFMLSNKVNNTIEGTRSSRNQKEDLPQEIFQSVTFRGIDFTGTELLAFMTKMKPPTNQNKLKSKGLCKISFMKES